MIELRSAPSLAAHFNAQASGTTNSYLPAPSTHLPRPASWPSVGRALSYRGPERRNGTSVMARLMGLMLDEIDYGLILMGADQELLHINHAARVELESVSGHLQLVDGRHLRARQAKDQQAVQDALQAASQRGLRRMLSLGEAGARSGVSVVPLGTPDVSGVATLLVMGKSQVCGQLAVQGFARAHRLSPGEEQVLASLCDGTSPSEIAQAHGVAISTVRTQIANIRQKTGAESIRDLIHQVAVLPPLVGALRQTFEGMSAAELRAA